MLPLKDLPSPTHSTEMLLSNSHPCADIQYRADIRELTEEAQGLNFACIHIHSQCWFYISLALFAAPFIYGCVYQILVPSTPSTVYFDSCFIQNNLNSTLVNTYTIGQRLSFAMCVGCNGGETNMVSVEPQQSGVLNLRVAAAVGNFLCFSILFTMRTKFGRYGRRSLALLAFGIYTVPAKFLEAKKFLFFLFASFLLLIFFYVQVQLINASSLQALPVGQVSSRDTSPVCYFYSGSTLIGKFRVLTIFFDNNTSTAGFGTTTPNFQELGSLLVAAFLLFAPVVWTVYSCYLSPYSALGLDILASGPRSGVGKIVASSIKYEVHMIPLCDGICSYYKKKMLPCSLTCIQKIVRLSGNLETHPPEEYLGDLWGDDPVIIGELIHSLPEGVATKS